MTQQHIAMARYWRHGACYVLCLDGGGGLLILNEKCQQNSPHYSVTSTRHRGGEMFYPGRGNNSVDVWIAEFA